MTRTADADEKYQTKMCIVWIIKAIMDTERKSHYIFSNFHVCKKSVQSVSSMQCFKQAFMILHLLNALFMNTSTICWILCCVRCIEQLSNWLYFLHIPWSLWNTYILHIDFSHVKNYLWLPPLLIIVARFHSPSLFSYYFLHLGHSFSRVSPPLKTIPTMWTAYRLWNVTMTAITIQQHAHVMLRYALDKFILNIYIGTMHKIWAKNTTRTFAL